MLQRQYDVHSGTMDENLLIFYIETRRMMVAERTPTEKGKGRPVEYGVEGPQGPRARPTYPGLPHRTGLVEWAPAPGRVHTSSRPHRTNGRRTGPCFLHVRALFHPAKGWNVRGHKDTRWFVGAG